VAVGADRGFEDRSARLVLFGALAVLLGAGAFLLGAASLLLALVGGTAGALPAAGVRAGAMSFALHALLAAALVWLGIGSILKRRWAPPLMAVAAWTWLVGGVLSLPLVPGLVRAATGSVGTLTPFAASLTALFVLGVAAGTGVLLPAVFLWVYRDRDLLSTCRRYDPAPSWTESCSNPVLALSVGLGALAALALPMLVQPVVPWFGAFIGGWRGGLLLGAGALASAWLSRETFRRTALGWWGATALLLLACASTIVTLSRVEAVEYYRELGYPEEQIELLRSSLGGSLPLALAAAMTVLTAAYLWWIRPHFFFSRGR
jgi:hypothetical protein